MKALGDLQPISPNILDRCRADGTGDQREVFQPRPTLGQRPLHKIMPILASPGFDVPRFVVFHEQALAGNRHVENQAVEIAVEDQIAAAAEDKALACWQLGCGQLRLSGDFLVARRLAGEGEGVEGGQVDVLLRGHRRIFADFGACLAVWICLAVLPVINLHPCTKFTTCFN